MSEKKNLSYLYDLDTKKIEISFLEKTDFCLLKNWNIKEFSINKEIQEVLKLECNESGLGLNFQILDKLAEKYNNLLHTILKKKESTLYTNQIWYCLTSIDLPEIENLLFFSWKFEVKESNISREQWFLKNGLTPYNCCKKNFLLEQGQSLSNSQTFENQQILENNCQYKSPFIEVTVTVAFSALKKVDEKILNLLLKNGFSQDFIDNLEKNQKFFPEKIVAQDYFCQFLSLSSFKKALKISKTLPPNVLKELESCHFLDLSEISCSDFLFFLNFQNYKQLLKNIFVSIYVNQMFLLFGNLQNSKIKIKLLGSCLLLDQEIV
jgi:hypothetical protein